MYYIYQHVKSDDGEVFYVGVGNKKRPYSKYGRNTYWHNVANKHGYNVEVLFSIDSWQIACDWERFLISLYGKRIDNTGCLVNMTDGGDGLLGMSFSEETRRKISDTHKGDKCYWYGRELSDSHKQKLSAKKIGNKNRKPLKVTCIDTGRIWGSRREAAQELGIKDGTLKVRMSKPENNRTSLRYLR